MVSRKKYEIMILVAGNLSEGEVQQWVFYFAKLLYALRVTELSVISLGKLRLSYPIQKRRAATYLKLTFDGLPQGIYPISKLLQRDAHIVRYLVMDRAN